MPVCEADRTQPIQRTPMPSPRELRERYPASPAALETVRAARDSIRRILRGGEDRFLVIVGPCSIHDPDAALEYARRLAPLAAALDDRLLVVVRAYFEKPRTTVGWRGLINDPYLDGTFAMDEGLRRARRLLVDIADLGLSTATELLDTATPDYFSDLVSFAAIGARTTESQPHRALASGIGMPVGFKNGTDGSIKIALDAMLSARSAHSYLGVDDEGRCCIIRTPGNPDTALILRGARKSEPNYDRVSVARAAAQMARADLPPMIVVDCSHANSGYLPERQPFVAEHVAAQRREGNRQIGGIMLESNLKEGKQNIPADLSQLRYGVSVTDACLGWDETAALLEKLHASLGGERIK